MSQALGWVVGDDTQGRGARAVSASLGLRPGQGAPSGQGAVGGAQDSAPPGEGAAFLPGSEGFKELEEEEGGEARGLGALLRAR